MMRKSKKAEIYKQGMKAGAAPFEKKYADISRQISNEERHLGEIERGQRKSKKVIDQALDGFQNIEKNVDEIESETAKVKKAIYKQQSKIGNIEKMLPSISTTCSSCGSMISTQQLVCSKCGAISKDFPFKLKDFNIEKECVEGVNGLAETIKENNSPDAGWLYPELEEKFIRMKKIRSIAQKACKERGDSAVVYKKIYDISSRFFANYKRKRIEIALVGTVKAGKSSLINALIGTSLASVDPTPETSILIKYRTTSFENYVHISFYTEVQWEKLWNDAKDTTVFRSEYEKLKAEDIKNEYLNQKDLHIVCDTDELQGLVMEWSKSDAPKHFFVREMEVGYRSDTIPNDVYLVDTPGLSDPVRYRSDITRKYIKKSDWILACIVGENLSQQPEFLFLTKVMANKGGDCSKIFVVATKKDMLTRVEAEKKREEFLLRLGELYKNNSSMAISRFSFVAAECHTLTHKVLRGDELSSDEREKLESALIRVPLSFADINDKSNEIFKYAGINDLFEKIDSTVLRERRTLILHAVLEDYAKCMKIINDNASMFIEESNEYIKQLTTSREIDQEQIDALEEANRELAILQKRVKELRNNLEDEIMAYEGVKMIPEVLE